MLNSIFKSKVYNRRRHMSFHFTILVILKDIVNGECSINQQNDPKVFTVVLFLEHCCYQLLIWRPRRDLICT